MSMIATHSAVIAGSKKSQPWPHSVSMAAPPVRVMSRPAWLNTCESGVRCVKRFHEQCTTTTTTHLWSEQLIAGLPLQVVRGVAEPPAVVVEGEDCLVG